MQLLAETFRRRGYYATSAAFNNDFRGYRNDINFHGEHFRSNALKRFVFFIFALLHYDIFHFFWGVSLFGFWRFHLLDLPVLKLFGKKIIVHFRGQDVLDNLYFDYLQKKSRGINISAPALSRNNQINMLHIWKRYSDILLVSTPDLHNVVQNSILSPQVIDLAYWRTCSNPLSEQDGIIRIVHAPSNRWKKGTDFIEESVARLKKKGYKIELLLAENMSYDQIRPLYELSDFGVDQVLHGWYGKVSVEIMAMGRPVICNIDPNLRQYRPDLPILHGDPTNLDVVIERLLKDKSLREQIGVASKQYVQKYHDVEKEVDNLLSLYAGRI